MEWIAFTLLAALMQSIRTAGQKHLTATLSPLVATWTRYGFGLPVSVAYLMAVITLTNPALPTFTWRFWFYVSLASVAQLVATLLLVKVLSQRNFAVGTTYAKTEAILAAIIGAALFSAVLPFQSWIAIAIGLTGIVMVSMAKKHLHIRTLLSDRSALFGIAAGLSFAITSVFIRQASLLLNESPVFTGALILALSLFMQGIICTILVQREDSDNWKKLAKHTKANIFVGVTGALGSIGWYTAFAYQDAAIVKAFGQVEFIFTVLITYFFFKEKVSRIEWFGMFAVIGSVLLLLMS